MEAWECGSEILFTLCIATISTQRTFLLTPKLSYSHTPILSSAPNAHVVGKDGFEPPNSGENRFTVCCRWPLDYLPDGNHCLPGNQLFKLDAMPGAREGSRTRDLLITNQLLYQLSYSGLILFTILPIYKELKQMYLSTCFFGKAKVSEFVKWKNFGVFFILIGSYCLFR